MKYKLIVSDVDGTLFQSGNRVMPRTVELVHQFQQKGGIFTLATGRMKKAIEPFIQELQIRFPVIVYNGTQIVDTRTNRVLTASYLEENLASTALELLEEYSLDPIIHVNQQPYVANHSKSILEHMEKDGIHCMIHDDLRQLITEKVTKMLIIGDPANLRQYAEELIRTASNGFQPVYSDWNYLEILPNGVSKGKALESLAKMERISMEEIVAVGDERNDISMLEAAGLGVAVANANEEVRRHADRVTSGSWNEGLDELIQWVIQESA